MIGDTFATQNAQSHSARQGEVDMPAPTEIDENDRLIASNKVEGTAVYNRNGDRLGSIYNFMVDKKSGKAEYAVLSFGGFLGIGNDYYPVPWGKLAYDTDKGGYVADISRDALDQAPRYTSGDEPMYDRSYGERVYGAYGLTYPTY